MPNLQLLVWNSQGGKWPAFWTHYVGPVVAAGQDTIGLLVEAGWAPWVTPGNVYEDTIYPRDTNASWFNKTVDQTDAFCQGVAGVPHRRGSAYWVPWVKNFWAQRVNTRCSMGAVMVPVTRSFGEVKRFISPDPRLYLRSIFRFELKRPSALGGSVELSVFLVHLVSGNPYRAQQQMDNLIAAMSKLIQQGTSAIVVGDFNIDIIYQAVPFQLPLGWSLLRTDGPTQQSAGELDFALLYDPTNAYQGATAAVVEAYNSGNNKSDHSVMRYTVPLT
ncbi:MAG TPA: hypothetical protein VFH48_43610 [Chloroflexota bacterium]|nr:hypothetical protein [Chloroflexota bacterium]